MRIFLFNRMLSKPKGSAAGNTVDFDNFFNLLLLLERGKRNFSPGEGFSFT